MEGAQPVCSIRATGAPEEPSWPLSMTSQMQSGIVPVPERACPILEIHIVKHRWGPQANKAHTSFLLYVSAHRELIHLSCAS